MPYYIGPYIETDNHRGSLTFRPRGSDQPGWAAIDLRPDGGATLDGGGLNACLLYLPVHDPDPLLDQIGDLATETLSALTKTRVRAALGLSRLDAPTLELAVEELLMNPPANGWNPLRAGHLGQRDISLGPLQRRRLNHESGQILSPLLPWLAAATGISVAWLLADPTLLWWALGTVINESFNKVDNGWGPDLTWTRFDGANDPKVLSNNAIGFDDNLEQSSRANTDLATDNHYSKPTLGTITGTGWFVGTICRKDATATKTYYRWAHFQGSGWELAEFNDPGNTTLHNTYTTAPSSADDFKLEVNGSTIKGFHTAATERASVTDSSITGNLRCGIHVKTWSTGPSRAPVNFWEAGDLAVASRPMFRGS